MGAVTHIPPLQVLWLVVYWTGLTPLLILLIIAVRGGAGFANFAALVIGLVAAAIAAVWATRIARLHVSSLVFVKGTTTIRVIAIAWLAIGAYIVVGAVVSSFFPVELGATGEALGFVGTVGSVSILAVLGPGYSEYREARSHAADAA